MSGKRRLIVPVLLAFVFACSLFIVVLENSKDTNPESSDRTDDEFVKLYWFIPDGFRADPDLFDIYSWANDGLLPNIKRVMDCGAYGFSEPVFPGHTPTNFATLLTGANPEVHGISDGPMHLSGYPLSVVSKSGFSSIAKKVPPIWFTLEQNGHKVALLSIPGSTPPELATGTTIRGRWGGWGVDFPQVIFTTSNRKDIRIRQGFRRRVFEFGPELTQYIESRSPEDWDMRLPDSYSDPKELVMENWGKTIYGYLFDSTDDSEENHDMVLFSQDKKEAIATLSAGEWSEWTVLDLKYELNNDYNINTPKKHDVELRLSSVELPVATKLHVIRVEGPNDYRVRFIYDNLNAHSVKPSIKADRIREEVGPMVDFADNFPAQLVYYQEDKQTFREEARMSIEWHNRAAKFLLKSDDSDVVIHDIYTPNQMLTSRWWLGFIDPDGRSYSVTEESERTRLFGEVLEMYQGIDKIIGTILDNLDDKSIFVLSSDHGAVPLNVEVRLNNLFASHGLLSYELNRENGEYEILWGQSRVVYLKMSGIYINPEGLGGLYEPAEGVEYESLREQVVEILTDLRDGEHTPVEDVISRENAQQWGMPEDRVGDLIIANSPGYGWVEDLTADGEVFAVPATSGYKQGIRPKDVTGMLTPFAICGPGVKRNYRLSRVLKHIDQYPTIMKMMKEKVPSFVQGKVVEEVFKQSN